MELHTLGEGEGCAGVASRSVVITFIQRSHLHIPLKCFIQTDWLTHCKTAWGSRDGGGMYYLALAHNRHAITTGRTIPLLSD